MTGPAIDLSSGYIQRAAASLPRQGERKPWRMNQDYLQDLFALRFSGLDDGDLHFLPPRPVRAAGCLTRSPCIHLSFNTAVP